MTKVPKEIWDAQPFGIISDAEIARQLGVRTTAVYKQRVKRKIPSRVIDWDLQPLGEMFDTELAAKLGVTKSHVALMRKVRGIPSFSEKYLWFSKKREMMKHL